MPRLVAAAAVVAIICAHRAAVVRHEVLTPGVRVFVALVSSVTGAMLIRANTDPAWRVSVRSTISGEGCWFVGLSGVPDNEGLGCRQVGMFAS